MHGHRGCDTSSMSHLHHALAAAKIGRFSVCTDTGGKKIFNAFWYELAEGDIAWFGQSLAKLVDDIIETASFIPVLFGNDSFCFNGASSARANLRCGIEQVGIFKTGDVFT